MARELREDLALLLHRYAWKESSFILKVLTREHGRVSLVGRGLRAGRGKAAFMPCQPVTLQWQAGNDLGRMISFSPVPPLRPAPVAERWWTAQYLGELVMRVLPEEEPATPVFDQMITALDQLREAEHSPSGVARVFEWALLQALGFVPDIRFDHRGEPLEEEAQYICSREEGLHRSGQRGVPGSDWLALQKGTLTTAQAKRLRPSLSEQLRFVVDLDQLRTPALWREARALRDRYPRDSRS